MRTIDLTPTWPEAARIIAAALENGTGEGRDAARSELFRMANLLDQLQRGADVRHTPTVSDDDDAEPSADAIAEHHAEMWRLWYGEAATDPDDLGHFALVVEGEDGTALRIKGEDIFGDRETAQAMADDWNDFAATKGTGQRFAVRRLSA